MVKNTDVEGLAACLLKVEVKSEKCVMVRRAWERNLMSHELRLV
jgi:hypothetical protein